MDDMTLLRQMRAEVPRPDPERLAAGRERLLAEMRSGADVTVPAGTVRPRFLRRPVVRVVLATAVVAAVAGGVMTVVGDHTRTAGPAGAPGLSSPRMQPVSATAVLNAAADHERRKETELAPRDDQFIYTKEIVKETERGTGRTRTFVDENWRSVDGSKRGWTMEVGKGWWSDPLKPNETMWPPAKWRELEELPTDPAELILSVQKWFGGRQPKAVADIDEQDWPNIEFGIAGLLYRTPVMPPGLRAAAFEALGMVPGVTTTPGVADAKGRPGIAVTYEDPTRQMPSNGAFIFAKGTYEFLGFKNTRTSDTAGETRTYTQLSSLESYAVVDKVKQRP
ncbi:CU044_5270 family protein [Streptomyces bungoensis]|uniref:CU044_5270 family protein n=1 Tax=Streptomyces bungoensis TaxID=285568 RepID=UPI00344ACC68